MCFQPAVNPVRLCKGITFTPPSFKTLNPKRDVYQHSLLFFLAAGKRQYFYCIKWRAGVLAFAGLDTKLPC